MTKKHRVTKAWQRNWEFYTHKGIYFIAGNPVKKWITPKQLERILKKESIELNRYFKELALYGKSM